MLLSGHLPKLDKRICPKISVYYSKPHFHKLSKLDTCLKWTKMLVPTVCTLKTGLTVVKTRNANWKGQTIFASWYWLYWLLLTCKKFLWLFSYFGEKTFETMAIFRFFPVLFNRRTDWRKRETLLHRTTPSWVQLRLNRRDLTGHESKVLFIR